MRYCGCGAGVSDPSDKSITVAHEIRTDMIMGHYIGLEEESQVHGYIFIFDFSGSSMKHMSRWSMDDLNKYHTMWQVSINQSINQQVLINQSINNNM